MCFTQVGIILVILLLTLKVCLSSLDADLGLLQHPRWSRPRSASVHGFIKGQVIRFLFTVSAKSFFSVWGVSHIKCGKMQYSVKQNL